MLKVLFIIAIIFFRTDQVVEKSNQKEKMCSAILNLYRIPENRKKKSYWHMRHRKEFQNLGLRIIFTSNVKLMDFEIKYIQDCLRKDPYEDGGIIFDTMLDDTIIWRKHITLIFIWKS